MELLASSVQWERRADLSLLAGYRGIAAISSLHCFLSLMKETGFQGNAQTLINRHIPTDSTGNEPIYPHTFHVVP